MPHGWPRHRDLGRRGLVDVLIIGTRTINVDVASFRKALAGAPVKLLPSFNCFHAADGYHGDQSLDLLRGVFGNYLHPGADGVGIFNNPAGSAEHARRLGLSQQANYDPEILTTIRSLDTILASRATMPSTGAGVVTRTTKATARRTTMHRCQSSCGTTARRSRSPCPSGSP